jgi:uncharacterized lipoprotein YajG
MNTSNAVIARARGVVLMAGVMLLAGCSIRVVPSSVPPVKGVEIPPLKDVSLFVRNVEKDSVDHAILTDRGNDLGFVANRQVWSAKLVEALSRELAKQGAQVRANAPLALSIAMPKISLTEQGGIYAFIVQAEVSASQRWSKTYDASAEAGVGAFESVDAMANRLAGRVLAETVKVMLTDKELLAQLTAKK